MVEGAAQKPNKKPSAHHAGHRDRLRERFLSTGEESLQDYEILEILLFAALPRRDVKPLAKKLLTEFGGLSGLLSATPERMKTQGLSDNVASLLRASAAAGRRALRREIMNQPILNTWQRVVDYCRASMAHESKEQFRILFLDRRNRLIAEEVQQRGTIDHTPVYPREIVQRALEVGAGAVLLVHNHPSGDATPSKADIEMTRAIIAACTPLEISVHDHLVVGRDDIVSFKAQGLM